MIPTRFPIHEMFATFQGEGSYMGLPAFFIRTFGCPVQCTFCDSAGTWHPEYIPKDVARLSVEEIADEVRKSEMGIVVITGGEPCIFDLRELTNALSYELKVHVHLETSGAFPIRGKFNHVVVSPKKAKPPLTESIDRADEFKFIIEDPDDIRFFTQMLLKSGASLSEGRWIWLHPEWSQRENKAVLSAIAEQVKRGKGAFRAGWQLHKLYRVDDLDNRIKPHAPLGGNPEKGY